MRVIRKYRGVRCNLPKTVYWCVTYKFSIYIFLQFVMVLLKGSVAISFGGNKEPAAFAEIVSMGGINSQVKKQLIFTIGTILQDKLSISRSRFFLKVYDTTAGRNNNSKL